MGNVGNIGIKPMIAYWGSDVSQIETITCVADVSSSLNNKYFYLYSGSTKYYVWYNVATAGVDPAPAGATELEIAISANASASAVATATQTAIDGLAAFTATVSGAVVTVTTVATGYHSGAHEGVGSGFAFAVTTQGDTETDVGCIDGDIEMSAEVSTVDITCHQEGAGLVGSLINGKTIEVTINFKETSAAQLKKIMRQGGGTFTPPGASATEVVGWGTGNNFQNTFNLASKLRLHPVALDASDKTQDWNFWKVFGTAGDITFSGENPFVVPVTFQVFPDTTKNARINYFMIGDGSQTLT